MNLLFERYKKEALQKLKNELGLTNNLAVPRITRVVINCGIGRIAQLPSDTSRKQIEQIIRELTVMCGQKPIVRAARKSIAGFKLRQGSQAGLMVTLRGKRMWDFLDRMVFFALPRTRDFRGISKNSVDAGGNLTIGLREQLVFPEISAEELHIPFGFEVTVVTNAGTKERGERLFRALGFPLKR